MSNLAHPSSDEHAAPKLLTRLPDVRFLNNLGIGGKLNIGFGILIALTLLMVGLSAVGGREAVENINLTEELRVPTALASARAQANLLRMQANVQNYLVLDNPQNRDDYNQVKQAFEVNLAELEALSVNWTDAEDIRRLEELGRIFEVWSMLPEQLFELHDNARENQPALRIARLEVQPLNVAILNEIERTIEGQEQREPSTENQLLLKDMINFRASHSALVAGLRAYATSGDLAFKFEYATNLTVNELVWESLLENKALLTASQQTNLNNIAQSRERLLRLPFQIFAAVEGEHAYEDLYLFRTEAVPRAERMLKLLDEMTTAQQTLLQADLNKGRRGLANTQVQTLIGGVLALALGIGMAFIFRMNITGPVRRLTDIAEQITAGNLTAQALIESGDEIGRLAETTNIMTNRLRETIEALRESEERFRVITETTPVPVLISRVSDGMILYANAQAGPTFGLTTEALVGRKTPDFYYDPADRPGLLDTLTQQGFVHNYEIQAKKADGTRFWVAVSLQTLTFKGEQALLSALYDITERKQTEQLLAEYNRDLEEAVTKRTWELSEALTNLKATQYQLVEAEKMAALGALVAGVAHEINTPVGVGVTAASLLEDKTTAFRNIYQSGQMKRSDLEKYLDTASQSSNMILNNLNRAAELIQSFKQVAVDQSSEERRLFAVKAYLDEILLSLHPKLKRTQLTLEIHAADSLTLDSYPGAFAQIVTNLVMNSLIHAYEPGAPGRLVFELKQEQGRFIFEYADDGRGIPKENLSKIFDPFFTTKRGQGGSGLGLHIIYNLVTQKLGGMIRCESEVGRGTRFVIEVPV